MFANTMYFREVYDLTAAQASDFSELYRARYAPHLERLGMRSVALWETVPLQDNGAQCIALWRFDQPEQMMHLSRALDDHSGGDRAILQARMELSANSVRREGWTMLAQQPAQTIEEQVTAGANLSLCLLEEVDLVANQYDLFTKALRVNFSRLLAGTGVQALAVFRPQLYSIKAEVLWGLQEGWTSLQRFADLEQHAEWDHWQAIAQTFRTGSRSRVLRSL